MVLQALLVSMLCMILLSDVRLYELVTTPRLTRLATNITSSAFGMPLDFLIYLATRGVLVTSVIGYAYRCGVGLARRHSKGGTSRAWFWRWCCFA